MEEQCELLKQRFHIKYKITWLLININHDRNYILGQTIPLTLSGQLVTETSTHTDAKMYLTYTHPYS